MCPAPLATTAFWSRIYLSLNFLWLGFRPVLVLVSLPESQAAEFCMPQPGRLLIDVLALRATRCSPCRCPFWSQHPSLTTLGRHESEARVGFYS